MPLHSVAALADLEAALEVQEKALCLNPFDSDAHAEKGHILFELGRYNDAFNSYDSALGLAPHNAVFHCQMGVIEYTLKRFDRAFMSFQNALDLGFSHPVIHYYRGITNEARDLFGDAIVCYELAFKLDPACVKALEHKAGILEMIGELEPAYSVYKELRSIKPSSEKYLRRKNRIAEKIMARDAPSVTPKSTSPKDADVTHAPVPPLTSALLGACWHGRTKSSTFCDASSFPRVKPVPKKADQNKKPLISESSEAEVENEDERYRFQPIKVY